MTPTDMLDKVIKLALGRFKLVDSIHGPAHWGRVYENGMRLIEVGSVADPVVVTCFAFFHDACREGDGSDLFHGPRSAKWIATLDLPLTENQRDLLMKAVAGHTNRFHSVCPTLAACWDADRLDISRIGGEDDPYPVDPTYLSTRVAKDSTLIAWAQNRAQGHMVPTFIAPYL